MIDIKVPSVGESISEVTLLKWTKKDGQYVDRDDVIAELESEKATFEVNAEKAGILKTSAHEGDTLKIGDVLASIDETAVKPEKTVIEKEKAKPEAVSQKSEVKNEKSEVKSEKPEVSANGTGVKKEAISHATHPPTPPAGGDGGLKASPVASAIIADKKVDPKTVTPSGFQGKILKDDVLAALSNPGKKAFAGTELKSRNVRTEKMSNLRKTISRRLVEAKNTTAMLTTFNEVDMSSIMEIRSKYKDKFKEIHGVGLGFMSFFAKACALSTRLSPGFRERARLKESRASRFRFSCSSTRPRLCQLAETPGLWESA
jgi:2-oxoglutarate dehydrogenase E2 component (dihydrolipoamide succinyltransferase)